MKMSLKSVTNILLFFLMSIFFSCGSSNQLLGTSIQLIQATYQPKFISENERGNLVILQFSKELSENFMINSVVLFDKKVQVNIPFHELKNQKLEVYIPEESHVLKNKSIEYHPKKEGFYYSIKGKEYFKKLNFKLVQN